jgi:hypothetical protein
MSDKLEQSKRDGAHALLASMAGEWEGVCKTWFEPGKLGDESPIKGTTRLVLDGMFLLHEYEGTLGGNPMKGMAIIGYSLGEEQWQVAWIDSIHNGTRIMHSTGDKGAPQDQPIVLGSYPPGDGSPDWGWRTTLELREPNNLVITHYNITPQGEEAPGVEINYKRTQPPA